LSTQVTGQVALQAAGQENSADVAPFSKLRVGDRIVLAQGATLEVIYFETGRREIWVGPAELVIAEGAAERLSGEAPSVQQFDAALGAELESLPVLISRAERDRAGQGVVRGATDAENPRSLLDAQELAAVEAALVRYKALRKIFDPRDVLPDIYYATILRGYGLNAEADQVLRAARDRCELCDLPPFSKSE
jgi:hypothetical protein